MVGAALRYKRSFWAIRQVEKAEIVNNTTQSSIMGRRQQVPVKMYSGQTVIEMHAVFFPLLRPQVLIRRPNCE